VVTSVEEATPARTSATRRPLRVCHVAYTFYETDNRVRRYAEVLARRGDDVDVIALRRPGQGKSDCTGGVRIYRIQPRRKTEGSQFIHLIKILFFLLRATLFVTVRQLKTRYDVIHVHNVPDFLVFSALVPKLMGSRIILDIHDILPELYGAKFGAAPNSKVFRGLLLVESASCRFADHVIVANDIWRDRLVQRAVRANKCTTILNYPDLRIFKPVARDPGGRDGKFLIVYPGTLSRHQGLDVAIKAFARVKARIPDAEFQIYGEGPARRELERLVQDYGLTRSVRIHDPLPLEQIARVIASADVGVEPKQAKGFGNEALSTKILEFLACGVPIVASRTEVHARYFDETIVRFFTPGDESELAERLLELSAADLDAAAYVETATAFATGYSWQAHVSEYECLLTVLTGIHTSSHEVP
jgi:glycosyltransferase involved in cell wall biosynthesis